MDTILGTPVTPPLRDLLAACQVGPGGVPEHLLGAVRRRRTVVDPPADPRKADPPVGRVLHSLAAEQDTAIGEDLTIEEMLTGAATQGAHSYHSRAVDNSRQKAEGPLLEHVNAAEKALWARPVSETWVFVPGVDREVQALIDSGSEINLAEQWLCDAAGWHAIVRPGWTLHTVTGTDYISVACPDVALVVADFETRHHVFVQPVVGYPLILGQPWRAWLRYRSGWQEDGTEQGYVEAPDGRRAVRFTVVDKDDERHRAYLSVRPSGPPKDFEDALRADNAKDGQGATEEWSRAPEEEEEGGSKDFR